MFKPQEPFFHTKPPPTRAMRGSFIFLKWVLIPLTFVITSYLSSAEESQTMPHPFGLDLFLNHVLQWRVPQKGSQESVLKLGLHSIIAGGICFAAASISSAGGVGGGALFLPILNLVAGLDLKRASSFSAFMVTGGSVSNVIYNICFKSPKSPNFGGKPLIDYDIALLSQPCMLLGVSVGVICNVVFPEWLVTLIFVALLAWSSFKTCRAGLLCWKGESEEVRRGEFCKLEVGFENGEKRLEEPLLGGVAESGLGIPLKKMMILLLIWFSFLLLQILRGDKDGKSVIQITRCGVGYWLVTLSQIPLAMVFTAYILLKVRLTDLVVQTSTETLPKVIFPVAALLSGILGGLFGIGGGLLMNPVLLQIGIPPQITAATSSFMILFSSSMSSVQFLMLGMKSVNQALVLAMGCFVASLIGIITIQRAVEKYGRASLIVFSVSMVMILSTVLITLFGSINVWKEYISGQYMGFKLPC